MSACSRAPSSARDSGSTPRCASSRCGAPPAGAHSTAPKRRGSRSRSSRSPSTKSTWSCGPGGVPAGSTRRLPRHAEVHDDLAVAAVEQQVLAAPAHRAHRPSGERAHVLGHAPAQPGLAHLDGGDAQARKLARKAASRDFDFGQLGHGTLLLVRGTKYTYTDLEMSAVNRWLSLLIVLPLAACVAMAQPPAAPDRQAGEATEATEAQDAPEAAEPSTAKLPEQELTGPVLYELLLGEIALQRGNPALAAQTYADLAQTHARSAHRAARDRGRELRAHAAIRARCGARLARGRPGVGRGAAVADRAADRRAQGRGGRALSRRSCSRATATRRRAASCSLGGYSRATRTSRPTCGSCARWRRAIRCCPRRTSRWRRRRWRPATKRGRSRKRARPGSCSRTGRSPRSTRRRSCSAATTRRPSSRSRRSSRSTRRRATRGWRTRGCSPATATTLRRASSSRSCSRTIRTTARSFTRSGCSRCS